MKEYIIGYVEIPEDYWESSCNVKYEVIEENNLQLELNL